MSRHATVSNKHSSIQLRHGAMSELQHLRKVMQHENDAPKQNRLEDPSVTSEKASELNDNSNRRSFKNTVNKGRLPSANVQVRLETATQRSDNHADPIKTETGIPKIQRFVRTRLNRHIRLNRKNLAERLLFESDILRQTIRLLNQIIVFGLFVGALRMSSKEPAKRGIYTTMDAHFDFEGLKKTKLKQEFMEEVVPTVARTSKQFFLHSTRYFQDASNSGAMRLLQDPVQFSRPLVVNEFNLQVRNFTFVAWVSTKTTFVEGYIFRKRPGNSEQDQDLSCWAWFLHKNHGPGLHYGGHDFFSTGQEFVNGNQFAVSAVAEQNEVKFPPEESAMLTITVTPTKVEFYRNLEKVYEANLSVPVSDCGNDGEGILLGSRDIEISQMTFYPQVLGPLFIQEIYESGGLLADIATGSTPAEASVTELETVGNTLTSSIKGVEFSIGDRQDLTEVGHVLAEVARQSGADTASPTAPLGKLSAPYDLHASNASTLVVDSDINRPYHLLVGGPYKLTATSDQDTETRSVVDLPSFRDTGMTLSFWYRHIPCTKSSCGLYLFSASPPGAEGDLCWTIWLENDAVWTDVVDSETPGMDNHYPRGFVDKAFWLDGTTTWRHLAWVFDETTDHFRWYVDGVLAIDQFYGKPVTKADCEGPTSLALGRSGPGYKLGAEAEIYDLRLYIHSHGSPLTDADIYKLAFPTYGLSIEDRHRCKGLWDPRLEDAEYQDVFGNSCEWYFKMKSEFPEVCDYTEVAEKCPKACATIQQCYELATTTKTYYTWKSIRRIESRHTNGTICLGSRYSKAAIVEECQAWVARGGPGSDDIRHWLDASTQEARLKVESRKLDLRSCEDLEMAIDEHCAFDSQQVADFTRDMMASGGEWTIGVWLKPTGLESKYETVDGFRFFPTFGLLASLSPPTNNVAWGKYVNPNGEVKLYSECDETDIDVSENIENRPITDDWTFLAVSRSNVQGAAPGDTVQGSWYVASNEAKDSEPSEMRVCPFNDQEFFTAIEINYPMIMSPIMMIPRALAFAEAQQHYLDNSDFMRVRQGPKSSRAQQVEEDKVDIDKALFQSKSVLMAPPLLFQSKVSESADCGFKYSKKMIESEHQKALERECTEPFQCDSSFADSPSKLMSCGGEAIEDSRVFNLEPKKFNNRLGFSDFLFSVSDAPFLMRDTEEGRRLITPDEFIGAGTQLLEISLVFYTPETGTTSVLSISADFRQAASAEVAINLQHITILEGSTLHQFIATQSIVIFFVLFMVFDGLNQARNVYKLHVTEHVLDVVQVAKVLLDLATAIMIIVFIGIRIPYIVDSAGETERIVGGLANIPWDSSEVSVAIKKDEFFAHISELQELLRYEEFQGTFCNVIIILNLFRVIQCTGLHPRLAILTSTLVKSADDIWHSAMLVLVLMCCFAGLGTWRFGDQYEIFSTIERSLQTEFEMTFGTFPKDWTQTRELQFFVVSYLILVFLLVQNFILAIIVEAYMATRQEVLDLETEQEFLSDIMASLTVHCYQYVKGWPDVKQVGEELELWMCKYSVGFRELYQTGLFPSQRSAVQFLRWYSQFDFCKPADVHEFVPTHDKEEALVHRIEKSIAALFGIQARTLKQEALESAVEKERRQAEKEGRLMNVSSMSPINKTTTHRQPPPLGRWASNPVTNGGPTKLPSMSSFSNGGADTREEIQESLHHEELMLEEQADILKTEKDLLETLYAESSRQSAVLNQVLRILTKDGVTMQAANKQAVTPIKLESEVGAVPYLGKGRLNLDQRGDAAMESERKSLSVFAA